ncbi:Predicted arabinose efflux permease, MFS family [Actinacidiphila alni]|uniref:Predicted arabinose efflux permease, MFS family n=1 Tax=Actinacidiphila alni TaxID=380248 RepID=A0A1I2KLW5_9ACTN|nr:MFS transporter [Actinacidiphila alni]SFF66217.1 Predicted arabinose efflux permease, MFS family [Actinacidiphila alni]
MKQIPGGPDFRRFFVGHAASLLGSSMAPLALAFSVLGTGAGSSGLGLVMAARIVPIVLMLLLGGVFADRLGGRRVMLASDAGRCVVQGVLAVVLLGRPALWELVVLVAAWGVGEAVFSPSRDALVPALTEGGALAGANSLLSVATSAASVAGPALAGLLVATTGPATVIVVDAATYAVSFLALLGLRLPAPPAGAARTIAADLRDGWSEFRSRTWVWVTSAQMGLFNLLVWAPFLVLGPVVARQRLGGAGSWGAVMAVYGTGAVVSGLLMLGRRPRRPVLVATAATAGWALPSAALAADRSVPWICAAALVAGAGSTVSMVLWTTATQRAVPPEALARVSAYSTLGAFAFGPLGLAAAGPLASAVGTRTVLGFGALWQAASVAVVLAVPAIRNVRQPAGAPAPGGLAADVTERAAP